VAQSSADFFFPVKAVGKRRIGFHFRMRNLDGYLSIGIEVGGLKRGCRAAAFNDRANAVVIELIARIDWSLHSHIFWQRIKSI
jgi:hypothetical protein